MTMLPVLFIAWTALGALFLLSLAYRGTLTRYEDDELFLDGHNASGERAHSDIVRKVNRLEPFVRSLGVATGAITVGIIGIYLYRAILVLQS